MNESRTVRVGLSPFGSRRQIDCHVPRARRPPTTGTVSDGDASSGSTMVRAVTGRPVAVSIQAFVVGQQSLEGGQEVVVGARPDLHDHESGRGVGHEDRQQPVTLAGDEPRARLGQVRQSRTDPGPDGELGRPYGKMLRRASRMRPMPPPAGADS